MIEIRCTRGVPGEAGAGAEQIKLLIAGHAGAGPAGADPVCAGVSALALTLAANLTELSADRLIGKPGIVLRPGYARLACCPEAGMAAVVRLIFDTVWSGLTALAGLYPDCITCEISN